jgi:hypothetical protein
MTKEFKTDTQTVSVFFVKIFQKKLAGKGEIKNFAFTNLFKPMSNMKKIVSFLLFLAVSFSCSVNNSVSSSRLIQKKKYSKGFTVFNKGVYKPSKANYTESDNTAIAKKGEHLTIDKKRINNIRLESVSSNQINEIRTIPINIENISSFSKSKNEITKKTKSLNQCDLIFLKTGDEILAKVLEVSDKEIKYKQCDNPDGPTFTKPTSAIFKIKYSNGTETVFNNNSTSNSSSGEDVLIPSDGGKSQVTAIILWFFLGLLGIHRFYLGHIGMGILYLLTGGLCGIGWIIDGVMLFMGSLKPKDGEYSQKI